jgi:hypothetical protein
MISLVWDQVLPVLVILLCLLVTAGAQQRAVGARSAHADALLQQRGVNLSDVRLGGGRGLMQTGGLVNSTSGDLVWGLRSATLCCCSHVKYPRQCQN